MLMHKKWSSVACTLSFALLLLFVLHALKTLDNLIDEETCYLKTTLNSELKGKLQKSPRSICKCPEVINYFCNTGTLPEENVLLNPKLESTCSLEATLLGKGQKVLSFSLFKESNKTFHRYLPGVLANLKRKERFYGDWVMRIYTDLDLEFDETLCSEYVCADPDIYFCPIPIGNLQNLQSDMHKMTWRFLPLGDPTVTQFLSRDLDSRLTKRERDAVSEWENSTAPFHSMRDHPNHQSEIMGGMWGANNEKLGCNVARNIQEEIKQIKWKKSDKNMNDQDILKTLIYDNYKKEILIHDSYHCSKFLDSVPFPTQREGSHEYVGGKSWDAAKKIPECPKTCRPSHGKYWRYC